MTVKNISLKYFKYVPSFNYIHIVQYLTFSDAQNWIKEINKIEGYEKYRIPRIEELEWMYFNKEKLGIDDFTCWSCEIERSEFDFERVRTFGFDIGKERLPENLNSNYKLMLILVDD